MSNLAQAPEKVKVTRLTAVELLPQRFKDFYANLDQAVLDLSEIELEEHFNRTPNDWALRKKLWELVAEAVATGSNTVVVDRWCDGVVHSAYVYQKLVHHPFRLAWILTPIEGFTDMYEESFHVVFNKLRKFIIRTEINSDNVKEFLKLAQEFANRTPSIGPIVQKVDQRLLAKHSHEHRKVEALSPPNDIDKQIEALEQAKLVSSAREVKEPE